VRFNDDGEPSGTAGKPIFGQIQSFNLTNILVVVIRYFGGVKLGTGGLIQAYKTAAREALSNGQVISKQWMDLLAVHFPYERMNDIMHLIKEEGLHPTSQDFGSECTIQLEIRKGKTEGFIKRISALENVDCRVI
jgi:putative IMPACT (imprinted ancient) family translation regulator